MTVIDGVNMDVPHENRRAVWDDDVTPCDRKFKARLHLDVGEEFVKTIIIDRDKFAYPDPWVTNTDNVELLKRYYHHVIRSAEMYTPENKSEESDINQFVEREQERINKRIAQLEFPTPTEWNSDISTAVCKAFYGLIENKLQWENLRVIDTCELSTLRYFSAYGRLFSDAIETVANAFRYAREDPTISLDACVEINENIVNYPMSHTVGGEEIDLYESNLVPEYIKMEYRNIRDTISDFVFASALITHPTIYLVDHFKIANGSHSETYVRYGRPLYNEDRNIVFHEFFHRIQSTFNAIDHTAKGNNVDLDSDNATDVTYMDVKDASPFVGFQEEMIDMWEQFVNSERNVLCEYQGKNIDEYFAVAFEYYMCSPETLKTKQPDVYGLIDRIVNIH